MKHLIILFVGVLTGIPTNLAGQESAAAHYTMPDGQTRSALELLPYIRGLGQQKVEALSVAAVNPLGIYEQALQSLHDHITSARIQFTLEQQTVFQRPIKGQGLKPLPARYRAEITGAFRKLYLYQESSDTISDFQPRLFVFDGQSSYIEKDGIGFLSAGRSTNESWLTRNLLAHLLLFVSADDRLTRKDNTLFLPQTMRQFADHIQMNPTSDSVDGIVCDVVNFDNQYFVWFESTSPYRMLRFVEMFAPVGQNPGAMNRILEFSDFQTIGELYQLPTQINALTYCTEVNSDDFGKLEFKRTFDIHRFDVNEQVPDQMFEITIPPNTEVHDSIQRRRYVTPASAIYLEEIVSQSAKTTSWSSQFSFRTWLFLTTTLLLAFWTARMLLQPSSRSQRVLSGN